MPKSNKLSKIQNMPLSKLMSLSRADLEKATRALVRESNKRLTVMKNKGLSSPSTEYINNMVVNLELRHAAEIKRV